MFACLHIPDASPEATAKLAELANCFAPSVELTAPGTVVFSLQGLQRLFGPPHQIAAEIARRGAERGLRARLAIASTPDTAMLAAAHYPGVTVVPRGQEPAWLEEIPLECVPMPPEIRETLERWGLKRLGDLAALPPAGLAERLGEEAVRLHDLALGRLCRPLRLAPPPTSYAEKLELDDPLNEREPLVFLLAQMLREICRRLAADGRAAGGIALSLRLESGTQHTRVLELPVPQTQVKPLVKLLELDLEAHPPPEAVTTVELSLAPAVPRTLQGGLFLPPSPEPEKLQITLARVVARAGPDAAGSPELLNTHRPDAFRMRPGLPGKSGYRQPAAAVRLALRFYRPPLPARVRMDGAQPRHLRARGVGGEIIEAAGPWRSSGDWWDAARWSRDEWDVALDCGGVFRIFHDLETHTWFVEGVYD
ncbi:MAG TPA: DNA polymerase Y family protein [Bryobacteraceae bacterium]|nr:DNA polymerase Y family protein [Bryobacteraceae bacterium]